MRTIFFNPSIVNQKKKIIIQKRKSFYPLFIVMLAVLLVHEPLVCLHFINIVNMMINYNQISIGCIALHNVIYTNKTKQKNAKIKIKIR